MRRAIGSVTAENLKGGIEAILNKFAFDKKKILSVTADEGRNILRLFKLRANSNEGKKMWGRISIH
jgi:hypothetical protein